MEKLEAALAKAREARKGGIAGDEVGSVGRGPAKARGATDWGGLPEVSITTEHARQTRIAALLGGKDATPYDMLRSRTIRMMKDSGWRRLAAGQREDPAIEVLPRWPLADLAPAPG